MEVNLKTTKCYLKPSVINHKNDSINRSDEIRSTNMVFYAFKSIFKALVYNETINNDIHGYTHP